MVPAGSVPSQESGSSSPGESGGESGSEGKTYRSKEQLMLRANSLKKALRQIIEQAEKGKKKLKIALPCFVTNSFCLHHFGTVMP